jgi:hypothetical protein
MNIRYLENHEIDKERWDELIDASPNGRIYAYSWWLDIAAKNWDALIADDYEFVMPIPVNKKWGVNRIGTPFITQQLGIFSKIEITTDVYIAFIQAIPRKFSEINLSINIANSLPVKGIQYKRRTNYILDINRPYNEIRAGYKSDACKSLKKKNTFQLIETQNINDIIQNYLDWNAQKVPWVVEQQYQLIARLMERAKEKNHLTVCQLVDENNIVQSSGFFPTSHGRAYHILSSQSPEGRKKGAKHFLIDNFIRKNCEKIKIFDFEGSDLPGVAEFFRKWGCTAEYYTEINYFQLPVLGKTIVPIAIKNRLTGLIRKSK